MEIRILKIVLFTWMLSIASVAVSHARDVTLQWSAVIDTTVTGYKLYYNADKVGPPFSGTGSTQGASPIDVQKVTSATVTGLDPNRSYYFAITAYNAAGTQSPYSNGVNVLEGIAPTASITFPASNATVSGTVSVTAGAADNVGVTKVEFYVNGGLKTSDTSTPYFYSWDTSSLAAGTYALMAKAYDAAGNVGQSSNLSVTLVKDTTAPAISITTPASGATVSGTTAITANASDNVGVSKIEYYDNGALLTANNVAPYSYNWNTTSAINGNHILTAKAYDNAGNVGQSSSVSVSVNNSVADSIKPTVSLTAPANGATVSGTASVSASAADNIGVTKVEFYRNGALQSTDTASPYSFSWNTASVANGAYTLSAKAYDAAGNAGLSANASVTVKNPTTLPSGSITAVFGNSAGSTYTNTIEDTFLNINNDVNATGAALNSYTWPAYTPSNAILLKWALSSLPAGAQIQSATLSLYLTGSGGDAQYEMPVSAVINKTPVISKSNGNTYDGVNLWSASSVPYGGVPLAQSDKAAAADTPLVDKVNGYKSWNVTSIVKNWVVTPASNKGLLVNSSSKATANSYRLFASSEATDAATRPKLVVIYTTLASVSDTTTPAAVITAPVAGETVSGSPTVTVSATDNVGVSKVEFYVDGTLKASDTAAPYSFGWATSSLTNGNYNLSAKAYDAAGNVGQSAIMTVAVANAVTYTAVFGNASGSTYTNTIEDTFLNLNNDVNATGAALNTYTWPASTPANAILLKWALSSLPAGAQIQSATLSLYLTGSGGDAQYEMPVSAVINKTPVISKSNGNTYDGVNAWSASSVPYGGVPLAQSDKSAAADAPLIGTIAGYKSWNVTNMVKGWVATPANNKGVLVDSSSKATADSYRLFASSEATDAATRPKLVVTYILN